MEIPQSTVAAWPAAVYIYLKQLNNYRFNASSPLQVAFYC